MDIARTPLAGRQPENLGEDPFLAGETVAQEVAAAKERHVIATLKHYVANNQRVERIGFRLPPNGAQRSNGIQVLAAERALQEIYEATFKRADRPAGADAVMCSYNRLNGPQTCESPALLGDLKASGFDGFVVPDFTFAVRDPLAATLAGVDLPGSAARAGGPPRCSPPAGCRRRGWTTSFAACCSRGGPVLMPWLDRVGAVLQVWYPGQQFGTALAGVLFADADPGGRLPVTFPASDDQGPAPPSHPERYPGAGGVERYDEGIFVGYRFYDQSGQTPLFPFGFGLAYARFRFDDLRVRTHGSDVVAEVLVRNVSDRAGSTVAHTKVTFRLDPANDLGVFDESAHRFVVVPGRYTLAVGASSRDLPVREPFEVGARGRR